MKAAAAFSSAALLAAASAACTAVNYPPDMLRGTSWRVVSLNGREVPPAGDYSMRFDANRGFAARFGCNSMGGSYALSGSVLTVRDLAQTLMGCPEPAASFESQASAILQQPMRVAFTSNERMGLSNPAGTIALDPVS